MLYDASRAIDDGLPAVGQADMVARVRPVVSSQALLRPDSSAADRYGAQARPNIPVIAAILALHVLMGVMLFQMRAHVVRKQAVALSVVNLTPPPPPPAQETPPSPPSVPRIVAPPPIVRTPVPPVRLVQTTPDPVPVPSFESPAVTPSPVVAPAGPPALPGMVQGGDLGAQMVSGKPPRYPVESRRKHEQGTVVLALTLGLDGAVENIAIARSSGFDRLDRAARDAVKGWRWKPQVRGGRPVRVKGVVEIPFVLRTDAA